MLYSSLHTSYHIIINDTKVISFLYVCMVNTIYLLSFVETPRKLIINLRGVSTKLNKDTKVNLVIITLHTRTINNTLFFSFFAKQEILRDKPAFSHHPTHS